MAARERRKDEELADLNDEDIRGRAADDEDEELEDADDLDEEDEGEGSDR